MSFAALLTQTATTWPPETPDGHDMPAGAPAPFSCRWQDKVERAVDAAGREYVSRAIIYTTDELPVDSWVSRQLTVVADPADAGAYRVRTSERSQDPGNGIVVWKATAG